MVISVSSLDQIIYEEPLKYHTREARVTRPKLNFGQSEREREGIEA